MKKLLKRGIYIIVFLICVGYMHSNIGVKALEYKAKIVNIPDSAATVLKNDDYPVYSRWCGVLPTDNRTIKVDYKGAEVTLGNFAGFRLNRKSSNNGNRTFDWITFPTTPFLDYDLYDARFKADIVNFSGMDRLTEVTKARMKILNVGYSDIEVDCDAHYKMGFKYTNEFEKECKNLRVGMRFKENKNFCFAVATELALWNCSSKIINHTDIYDDLKAKEDSQQDDLDFIISMARKIDSIVRRDYGEGSFVEENPLYFDANDAKMKYIESVSVNSDSAKQQMIGEYLYKGPYYLSTGSRNLLDPTGHTKAFERYWLSEIKVKDCGFIKSYGDCECEVVKDTYLSNTIRNVSISTTPEPFYIRVKNNSFNDSTNQTLFIELVDIRGWHKFMYSFSKTRGDINGDGYIGLLASPLKATISVPVQFEKEQTVTIPIKVKDEVTKELITNGNLTLGLYEDRACTKRSSRYGSNVTTNKGEFNFASLSNGTYYLKVETVPNEYNLSGNNVIELNTSSNQEVEVKLRKKNTSLKVKIKDVETNEIITKGTKRLGIYIDEKCTVLGKSLIESVSGIPGEFTIDNLEYKQYYVKVLKIPNEYSLVDNQVIGVNTNNTSEIEIKVKKRKNSIIIRIYDGELSKGLPDNLEIYKSTNKDDDNNNDDDIKEEKENVDEYKEIPEGKYYNSREVINAKINQKMELEPGTYYVRIGTREWARENKLIRMDKNIGIAFYYKEEGKKGKEAIFKVKIADNKIEDKEIILRSYKIEDVEIRCKYKESNRVVEGANVRIIEMPGKNMIDEHEGSKDGVKLNSVESQTDEFGVAHFEMLCQMGIKYRVDVKTSKNKEYVNKALIEIAKDGDNCWDIYVEENSEQSKNEEPENKEPQPVRVEDVIITHNDQNGNPIKDSKFELCDMLGNKITQEQTTDEKGEVNFEKIAVGKYKVVLTKIPEGYEYFGSREWEIEVKKGEKSKRVKFSHINRTLNLLVKDKKGREIKNAEFTLKNADGSDISWLREKTKRSDDKGVVSWERVSPGTYKIVQTVLPEGYRFVKDGSGGEIKEYAVTVLAEKNPEVLIINNNKITNGSVEFECVEQGVMPAQSRGPIEGIKLGIYANVDGKPGEMIKGELVSGKDGMVKVEGLEEGEYYYNEYETPRNDIIINKEQKKFSIEDGQVAHILISHERIKANLQVHIQDDYAQPVEGVKLDVIKDETNKVEDKIRTNESGTALTKELEKGDYTVKAIESSKLNQIKIDTSVEYKVTVNEDGTVTNKGTNKEKNDNVEVNPNDPINIIAGTKKGQIEIKSIVDNKEDKVLKDVKYEILNVDKEKVEEVVTKEDGIARTSNLVVGTYYYKQVSVPTNVEIAPKETKVELKEDEEVKKVIVTNDSLRGSLEIVNKGADGKLLKGAKFEIYDKENKKVESITTDEQGNAKAEKIMEGEYYYKQVKAVNGYSMDEKEYEFKIENANVVKKEVINEKMVSKLKIVKLDKDSKRPIKNVEYDVLTEEKEIIESIITDESGVATSRELEPGIYLYREVGAPVEYMFDDEVYTDIKITGTDKEIRKTEYNELKKLPQTGGAISTDEIIVIVVSAVSIIGYIIISIVVKGKNKGKYKPY